MIAKKKYEKFSDEKLVGLTRVNPDFYSFLVFRYEEKILRYIRRISNVTKEASEDLGQEIFLKAYENIYDFDESLKFSSWLYRIAHNHVISYWRKNKKEQGVLSWDADENLKNFLEDNCDLALELDRDMARDKIGEILGQLKQISREVLVLKYLECKDYQEISDILKKPTGTIGTLILRAKKEFREKVVENNVKI